MSILLKYICVCMIGQCVSIDSDFQASVAV